MSCNPSLQIKIADVPRCWEYAFFTENTDGALYKIIVYFGEDDEGRTYMTSARDSFYTGAGR
jgi:hypothetical protein